MNNSRLYGFPSNWENDPETGFEEITGHVLEPDFWLDMTSG